MLRALALTIISLYTAATNAGVGKVTEQSGPMEIQRDKQVIESQTSTEVEMQDAIVTARSRAQITFQDDTKVQITEQSKLVIDDFVYDPNKSDAGKVGLKVALGTARYASGQIAKNNPQSVKVETPTATIGVRGTDFSMTVDELGRSLVVLLPSCPAGWKNIEKDCKTGKITVTTDMGTETLDKPFQATRTVSREQNPSKSVILKLTPDMINNMLIVTPPKQVEGTKNNTQKTALDINFLDQDFLKFEALTFDFFAADKAALDVNKLDAEFLINMLDLLNSQLLENMLGDKEQMLINYKPNKAAGLYYYLDYNKLTLYRTAPSHFVSISVDKESASTLNIQQDDVTMKQIVNRDGGTRISVKQTK